MLNSTNWLEVELDHLKRLKRLADMKEYRRQPPTLFLKEMGIEERSKKIRVEAWNLFRRRRCEITIEDVEAHLHARRQNADQSDQSYEIGEVASHFLDSGSFTLWTESEKYGRANGCSKWDYYDTPEFWEYIDAYAVFVQKHKIGIDYYANVDAIPNPELTYRNQKYLEEAFDLNPVPVVHYRTDMSWLRRYIEEGYDFVALGGLVGSMTKDGCRGWIDRCFDVICDTPNRMPAIKVHGFGVTNYSMMWRYPWFSVDSTVWTKLGAYGDILVPHMRGGKFVFNERPYKISVSMDSPSASIPGNHYLTSSPTEQRLIRTWLESIGLKIGKVAPDGTILEYGVMTRHTERRAANLHFFEHMRAAMPEWPWAWRSKRRKGLGLIK